MRNRWGQKKKNEKRENELRDVLIYGWKKKIIVRALRLYLIAFPLCLGVGLATTVLMGVDMAALAEFMRKMMQDFEMRDLFYLFAELLVIVSVWMIPALLVYGAVCVGERRFLRVYREMPQEAKRALYECWIKGRSPEHLTVYEACGYILFNDRCIFGTPQIVRAEDVVWGYIGRSDLQFTDMEKNYIFPRLQFFSLCFYTRDGRRHRIFANVSLDEVAVWFTTHCPRAILGYGVEQKRKAEDIFKREAEQRAFLYGKEKDSYPVRKRRAAWLAVGGGFLAVMLSLAGFYGWQYINSDDYLYQKNMKKGDRWYAEGEFFEAWQAYRAVAGYREGKDEAAMKGLMLSGLELKKINSEPVYITLVYEELIDCQEMFMGEMDISVWYFECAEYYLMDEKPLFAVELLERGIETFEDPETIVWEGDAEEPESVTEQGTGEEEAGCREEILQNMQSKREDILARCEVASVEEYTDGKLSRRIWYDEENREIMETNGRYLPRRWTYKTYDDAGNLVCEEICREEESGEKVKKKEKNWSYDEDGHLLHEEHYDLERGEITYEADYEYDESGNRIYLKKSPRRSTIRVF